MQGYSLSWLMREREELRRDRYSFASALDILKKRIMESNETEIPRKPLLHEWSGTRSVVGSLEMSLNAIERTLSEVEHFILAIETGEVANLDAPPLKTTEGTN
jgi:hypothetical protein